MTEMDNRISRHKRLLYALLKAYYLLNDQDAESIAYEALHKALVDFDKNSGLRESTLIVVYIKNALGSYIRTLKKQRQLEVISYHNVAYEDEQGSHDFLEMLTTSESVESTLMKQELYKKLNEAYDEAFIQLASERHKQIIGLWHDSAYVMQQSEIAKAVGVSQPTVCQVINTFKFRLKRKLEEYYYD